MIQARSNPTRLVIYGAGGHGLVVAEAAEAAGYQVVGFIDDAPSQSIITRWPVSTAEEFQEELATYIVAIGENVLRQSATNKLTAEGVKIETVIHPSAHISSSAVIGSGVFVGPRAVVHGEAQIGNGAIINSGVIVEHHCNIGAYVHLAPGSVLGGAVNIEPLTLVGLNATILPQVCIGSQCIIGAGAVIRQNMADGEKSV